MPRDSNGIFTLESGYLAVAGATIQPSQHNPVLEDIGSAMTASLPRNGSAPMTGQLKLSDGTAALPALAINSLAGMGLYKTATPGIGFSVGGALVFELTASGPSVPGAFTSGGVLTGTIIKASTLGTAAAPAFTFTADPDTGLYSPSANIVSIATSGVERIRFSDAAVPILPLYPVGFTDGAVGAPSITFASDPDTGLYRQGTNTLSVATSGAERIRFTAADILTLVPLKIPNGTAGAPSITPFGDAATGLYSAGSNSISVSAGSVERIRVSNGSGQAVVAISGNTTIRGNGSSAATSALYVDNSSATGLLAVRDDGYTQIPGAYANTTGTSPNMVVQGDGGLTRSTSSLRYKKDVQDYAPGLAGLAKLRPVTFRTKTDGAMRFAGFIAEEVHDAGLVEFVVYDDQGRPDALHYANMVAILTSAIQEAAAKIEALTSRIEALEG